jgi:hypothetical protein
MTTTISDGTPPPEPPAGDPVAQAVASLRGYAYQLYASGLAWRDLKPGEELYLEVAEDYAVATGEALRAVQVRNTTETVTLNAEGARDALDHFVDLVERNPGRQLQYHYLSTSSVGKEQRLDHRANGEASLVYWRRAAAGADVQPLRGVLGKIALSDRVRAFIDARGEAAFRDDLLRRIHWECGQQPIEGIVRELENGLLRYYVDQYGRPARKDQLAAAVVQRLLLTSAQAGTRRLTRDDLLAVVTEAANVLVPNPFYEPFSPNAGAPAGAPLQTIEVAEILEAEGERPMPPILSERPEVTVNVLDKARRHGIGIVTGSSGCGKTTVARLTARRHASDWRLLDLRDTSAEQSTQRLDEALAALGTLTTGGVILDDLNEMEDPHARLALIRFLSGLRRRDILCIITAYRKPSTRALSELGVDDRVHFAVPDLSEVEVSAMVSAAGGDAATWAKAVYVAGAFGHPQLVQAVIWGLRSRGWPKSEAASLASFDQSTDAAADRQAARNRIVADLPADARMLLYRISLLFDRFDRPLAVALGAMSPAVSEPGVKLDQVIGQWVEPLAYGQMRMSPLLQNAGNDVLAPDDRKSVHTTAATHILGGRSVAIDKANAGFMHALLGECEWLLTRVAHSIIRTPSAERRQLSEWIVTLRLHRLDRKIYPNRLAVSIMLRLSQYLLVAVTGKGLAIRNCWRVLQAEIQEMDHAEAREHLEFMALATALLDPEAAPILPDGVDLILRLEALSQDDPVRRRQFEQPTPPDARGSSRTLLGTLFITYMSRIPGVADLQRAFDRLDAATHEQRERLLRDVVTMPRDFASIINHGWLAESRRKNPKWAAYAQAYGAMADQAQRWGYRELALRCHAARSVILEEYLEDTAAGLAALDEAEILLGVDPILDRARAKILFRRSDYSGALHLFRASARRMDLNDPISRTYLLREAGVCAAHLGEWAEAQRWFSAAREQASLPQSPSMHLMAIGLKADAALAAFNAGDAQAALTGFDIALNELEPIDPNSSIAASYRHRIVRHGILWLFGQATRTEVDVDGQPALMLPGMCSNPEPTDLTDLPLGSTHYARYLLSQAEIATGVSAGIEAGLRAHLDGRAIPNAEILLRSTRMDFSIGRLDAVGLIAALPPWLDSRMYLVARPDLVRQGDPQNPAYGEIDPIAAEQLRSQTAVEITDDALLSFGILAAIELRPDALATLCALRDEIPAGYPGRKILEQMASGQRAEEAIRAYTAAQIHHVANHAELTPDELFVANVRFAQWANRSVFTKLLAPALERWTRARWSAAIEEQRFNLRNPTTSVPPIRDALAVTTKGLSFVGRLIVAAEPAVHTRFDQAFRDYLRSL